MKQQKIVTKRRQGKSVLVSSVKGMVKAQKCKTCSHHEMGIVIDGGHYIPLKPGMKRVSFRRAFKENKAKLIFER
jgi:hypothetical protein